MATHSEAPVVETRRFTADEILQGTLDNARNELRRSLVKLGFSGIAGGITMGLTALGVSSIRAFVGDGGWRDLVGYLAYPLGFIAVIIGRAQLFTENTLYPVVIALVAWIVTASHWTIGQLTVIYLLTFVVGVGRFAHCIAGSCEILAAVLHGAISTYTYFHWLLPATAGNICGGTVIVSLLNYGQVRAS
jgi:formate/nitrite transporter FocA (FNT family)